MNGEIEETPTMKPAISNSSRTTGTIHQALCSRAKAQSSRSKRAKFFRARMGESVLVLVRGELAGRGAGEPGRKVLLFEKIRPDREAIHVGGEEALDRLARMANGRFAADVEGGVHQHGTAGAVGEGGEQRVQGGIHGAIDRLDAR